MNFAPVKNIKTLTDIYGSPKAPSIDKVSDRLTPEYAALLNASPFFALASVGPEGLDCSPRGEAGGAFVIHNEKTLIIPDRRGNNRIDTLRNIVRNPEVALLFLIPGSITTVRINGKAIVTIDEPLLASMAREGKIPRSAIVVTIREIYFQCGRAILRSGLWDGSKHIDPSSLPSPGEILKAQTAGDFDGDAYDAGWGEKAENTMW